jgi:uncharacterized membrane protein YagU involved in acid resistance
VNANHRWADDIYHNAVAGAFSGVAAMGPMTVIMDFGSQIFSRNGEPAPPPRKAAKEIVKKTGSHLSANQKRALTIAAHYGYGAAVGAVYGLLFHGRHRNALTGSAYGLAVWTGSNIRLLPTMNILQPPTKHPVERNALMVAAHLAWGAFLGSGIARK